MQQSAPPNPPALGVLDTFSPSILEESLSPCTIPRHYLIPSPTPASDDQNATARASPFGTMTGHLPCLRPLSKVVKTWGLKLRASGPPSQVSQPHLDSCWGTMGRTVAGGCLRSGLISPKSQAEAGKVSPREWSFHQSFQVGDPGTLSILKDRAQNSGSL